MITTIERQFAAILDIDAERVSHVAGDPNVLIIHGAIPIGPPLLAACQGLCDTHGWKVLQLYPKEKDRCGPWIASRLCHRCDTPMKRIEHTDKHGDRWTTVECYNQTCLFSGKALASDAAMQMFGGDGRTGLYFTAGLPGTTYKLHATRPGECATEVALQHGRRLVPPTPDEWLKLFGNKEPIDELEARAKAAATERQAAADFAARVKIPAFRLSQGLAQRDTPAYLD